MTDELRILLLEDSVIDADLVDRELRKAGLVFALQRVESEEAFTVQCKTYQPNVILSDYALPAFDGLSALKIAQQICLDVPFILVSGVLGEETAIDSLKLGATDYVLKQHLSRLAPAVTRALHEAQERRERKRAEEALRRSEQYFRALIENSSEIVTLVSSKGIILYEAASVERVLGYKPEELVGKNAFRIVHPDDLSQVLKAFSDYSKIRGISPSLEMRVRHKDGSWRVFEARGNNLLFDPSVKGIVINSHDITERKRIEEELRYLSTHDGLTGLHNRAFFETEVERLARGRQFPVSVIVADMDGLKEINDTQGHTVGDQLLKRTAQVFQAVFRSEDIVARIGGDEFAMLLPSVDAKMADNFLGRIRNRLTIHNSQAHSPPLNLSIGAATADRGEGLSYVLHRADANMYADKASKASQIGWGGRDRGRSFYEARGENG